MTIERTPEDVQRFHEDMRMRRIADKIETTPFKIVRQGRAPKLMLAFERGGKVKAYLVPGDEHNQECFDAMREIKEQFESLPKLIKCLEETCGAIREELDASGPDEVKEHPVLKDHYDTLTQAERCLKSVRASKKPTSR